ncbi:hypothetical protein GXW82_20760 [Streptacidiphilus sp. 4-A2]|nr:hypothetical protein [Streptacidiphilus sp. 4-A2]
MRLHQIQFARALRRRAATDDPQRGALSLFVAITFTGMVLALALIVDSSGRLDAGVQADEYANEAARAGIQQINAADAISGKSIQIDCAQAKSAAEHYLAGLGLAGTPVCEGPRTLAVTIRTSYATKMLSIIGVDNIPITGQGEATLVTGQQQPNSEQP